MQHWILPMGTMRTKATSCQVLSALPSVEDDATN